MRHQKKRHKLGRTKSHRKATLAALGTALIQHKRITTTEPKAKALRGFIEPLITRAKEDTSHNRRQVFRRLQDNGAVSELFAEVSAQVGDRPGGYTRVVKLGRRAGDGAPLAVIELVDYNDVQPDEGKGGRGRTRRGGGKGRRRSRSKGAETQQPAATEASTETSKQVETASKDVETATVEEPVSGEQATPVTDRTEAGDVPEDQVEAAEEAIEEQKAKAETADEAPTAEAETAIEEEAPQAETAAEEEAPEAETATEEEAPETETAGDEPKAEAETAAEEEAPETETAGEEPKAETETATEEEAATEGKEEKQKASAEEEPEAEADGEEEEEK